MSPLCKCYPIFYCLLIPYVLLFSESTKKNVVLLANSNIPESISLAQYYAEARAIDRENIIALPLSYEEEISWDEYEMKIANPLKDELLKRGLLREESHLSANLKSSQNRFKHTFDYLLVLKGVSLKCSDSSELHKKSRQRGIMPKTGFSHDYASIDSELSLLLVQKGSRSGWVENPFFNRKKVPSVFNETFIKVSRIDGPTYDDCKRMIRNTLKAEIHGLIGRAYIDRGETTVKGERWLKKTEEILRSVGYDLGVDSKEGLMPLNARFDRPAFYFGWYGYHALGPWQKDSVLFPPGSIFFHIHSFSGRTLRSGNQNWVGPMVQAGVTATIGNVNEPFLDLTHHPHLMMQSLVNGSNWGDAVYYSLPSLSWQSFSIGDPLYTPFKLSIEEQMMDDWSDWYKGQYIAVRYINQFVVRGLIHRAIDWGMQHLMNSPGRVLSLRLAELCKEVEDYQKLEVVVRSFINTSENEQINDKLLIMSAIEVLQGLEEFEDLNLLKVQLLDRFERGLQ